MRACTSACACLHALVARHDVRCGVALRVADVEAGAATGKCGACDQREHGSSAGRRRYRQAHARRAFGERGSAGDMGMKAVKEGIGW
eukprot:106154-Chlamydomonas_euryale.AAC.3